MNDAWKHWEGQVVDAKFHLRQYLGGSQRSAVFLTEPVGQETGKVAIKLILIDPASAELQLYRWKEAAKLSHPHLIRLFQVGRCHLDNMSLLYAVMEYAEEDLSQVLPQRPLTSEEARAMLETALETLTYLHGQGLVHGGLKPSNIMAVEDQVKLSSDAVCEITESTAGTAPPTPYDPPEAASGRASTAADVWSLGMTLAEVLTQQLPVLDESRQEAVLPETLPEGFDSIVQQCLRRDPLQRPTVQDVMDRLHGRPAPEKNVAKTPAKSTENIKKVAEKRPDTYLAKPTPPARVVAAQKPPVAKRRSAVPAVAIAVALVVLLGGWSLLRNRNKTQQTLSSSSSDSPSSSIDQPTAPSAPSAPSESPSAAAPPAGSKPNAARPERNVGNQEQPGGATPAPAPRQSAAPSADAARGPSPGPAHGAVIDQPLPDVSRSARDSIRGTLRVSVKVHVDAAGHVTDAALDSPGPSRYFADQALKTARKWTFQPGKANGESVPSEWMLRFEFRNTDTKVIPEQTSP
jgi:TonB family protein